MIDIAAPVLILAFATMFALTAILSYFLAVAVQEAGRRNGKRDAKRRRAAAKRHKARIAHIRSGAWGAL